MSGLRKPRFIHKQTPWGKYRGWSVLMVPSETPGVVNLTEVMCVKNDAFCRRDARSALLRKEGEDILVVDLPERLALLDMKALGYRNAEAINMDTRHYANQWAWVWKYFL